MKLNKPIDVIKISKRMNIEWVHKAQQIYMAPG